MNFFLDILFTVFSDLLSAIVGIPVAVITQWLVTLFTPTA
jgi:hypothetical protein